MSAKPGQAVNVFKEGSNCSQAVISVYAEDFGLSREKRPEDIPRFRRWNGANGSDLRGGNRRVYGSWPEIWKRRYT